VRTGGSTKYMYQGRYKSLNSLQKNFPLRTTILSNFLDLSSNKKKIFLHISQSKYTTISSRQQKEIKNVFQRIFKLFQLISKFNKFVNGDLVTKFQYRL
jgi:hypothetical protein